MTMFFFALFLIITLEVDSASLFPQKDSFLRIVGGENAKKDEFPYLAMLTTPNGYVFCGGTLISDYYVLTAGHCVDSKLPSGIVVRLGEYDWSTNEDGQHVDIAVKERILHPKYFRLAAYNDIAILRLNNSPPRITNRIRPICFPPPNLSFVDEKVTIAGWGTDDINVGLPLPVLQKLHMRVISHDSCKKYFIQPFVFLNKDKICSWSDHKNSCKGDSGGPVIWIDPNGKTERTKTRLVGVISMGFRCGETNKPALNTRITSFFDWIKNNTKDDNTLCW